MNKMQIRTKFLLLIVIFSTILIRTGFAETGDKIVFLQFFIDSNDIKLTKSTFADGQLKSPRVAEPTKDIYFEVVSGNSELLFSGNIENPLVKILEYENPDKPGKILQKIINLESVEFTVRINYDKSIDKINFYHTESDNDLHTIRDSNNLISSVSLNSIIGGENE